jgi:hypothetical protein
MKAALVLLILFLPPVAFGQGASTTHVFPQVADGRLADGSIYISRLWITNIGGNTATCTLSLFGMNSDRLASPATTVVQHSSWATMATFGQQPLSTGYARLDCSQPVFASLTYSLASPAGTTQGISTVLSSPAASYAAIPVVMNGRYRYGIAIANDNDLPLTAAIIFSSGPGGGGMSIQVPAHGQYVKFIDEIFPSLIQADGTIEIVANGSAGSANFNVTGLLFDGQAFTTLNPATVR